MLKIVVSFTIWICFWINTLEGSGGCWNNGSSPCSEFQFSCVSNCQCIPKSWTCDSQEDCTDSSDEQETFCKNHAVTKDMPVKSSNEITTLPAPSSSKTLKHDSDTSVPTLNSLFKYENKMDNITQSENHKRNVSRIPTQTHPVINGTMRTPLGNNFLLRKISRTLLVSNNATSSHTEKSTPSYRQNESQLSEDFLSKTKQIQELKALRENAHSVKKDMYSYYKDRTSDSDEFPTGTTNSVGNRHHITVKKSLNIDEEFLVPKFYSTEQSIPNFNIGTDFENLTPSTQNTEEIFSDIEKGVIKDARNETVTTPSSLQTDSEKPTNQSERANFDYPTITSSSTLVLMPTPHIHSNVMKTNFLNRPSSPRKNDQSVKQNTSSVINHRIDTKPGINSNQSTFAKESNESRDGKVNKISAPFEEKIEDTVFYTDIVDPEDQFDKKNEIYKNNYLDQSEYQAILDKFFNGKKQNRKMKVPKNILSIDKLLEQNTKKPIYLYNEGKMIKHATEVANKTGKVQENEDIFVRGSEQVENLTTERIPETIILKDLDNMSAARDTNPFIHWDDINENQQLDSYRRKNKDWFILQLTGNSTIVKLRQHDFIKYLKLNLAARLSVEYNEVHLNQVVLKPPQLLVNISIIPSTDHVMASGGGLEEYVDVVDQTPEEAPLNRLAETNDTLLELSGEEYHVVRFLSLKSQEPLSTEERSHIHRMIKDDHKDLEIFILISVGVLCLLMIFYCALSAAQSLRRYLSSHSISWPWNRPKDLFPAWNLPHRRMNDVASPTDPLKVIYTGNETTWFDDNIPSTTLHHPEDSPVFGLRALSNIDLGASLEYSPRFQVQMMRCSRSQVLVTSTPGKQRKQNVKAECHENPNYLVQ